MKILLDECLNWRLKHEIPGHEVRTVQEMGWNGIVNGELLSKASVAGFDIFVTVDKNLTFQQDIQAHNLAIAVFDVYRNKLESLRPLLPEFLKRIPHMKAGEVIVLSGE